MQSDITLKPAVIDFFGHFGPAQQVVNTTVEYYHYICLFTYPDMEQH